MKNLIRNNTMSGSIRVSSDTVGVVVSVGVGVGCAIAHASHLGGIGISPAATGSENTVRHRAMIRRRCMSRESSVSG